MALPGAAGCVHLRARQSSSCLELLTNLRSIAPPPSLGEVGAFSSMWNGMPLPSPLLPPPGGALHLLCALGVPKHMLSRVRVPRRLPPDMPALVAVLASQCAAAGMRDTTETCVERPGCGRGGRCKPAGFCSWKLCRTRLQHGLQA